jgi:hypothetical protein
MSNSFNDLSRYEWWLLRKRENSEHPVEKAEDLEKEMEITKF